MRREGGKRMEQSWTILDNLFLTTLLAGVVIGVLIIYHVTPEG
jgi:hypothetical protein